LNPSFKITICDDSRLAQHQIALAISDWDVDICYADNGVQAIEAIKDDCAQLLFLDLNMPVMDGYQVLQQVRDEDLPTMVIVVSGDIQPKALLKTKQLGAIAFIKKPIDTVKLNEIVRDFGLASQIRIDSNHYDQSKSVDTICPTQEERFQETANIAMGKAAERLSVLLDTFINLSIPKVNLLSNVQLHKIIKGDRCNDFSSSVSQGFVGGGISGESILIIDKTNLPYISQLLGYSSEIDSELEFDIIIDLAGLLGSSFLKAFFQQIGIGHINQGTPSLLDYEGQLDHLINQTSTDKNLAIEVTYNIVEHGIHCDLVLVFTLDSLEPMNQRSELFSWTL
jgi:CheY-like chemotaxis protein